MSIFLINRQHCHNRRRPLRHHRLKTALLTRRPLTRSHHRPPRPLMHRYPRQLMAAVAVVVVVI